MFNAVLNQHDGFADTLSVSCWKTTCVRFLNSYTKLELKVIFSVRLKVFLSLFNKSIDSGFIFKQLEIGSSFDSSSCGVLLTV